MEWHKKGDNGKKLNNEEDIDNEEEVNSIRPVSEDGQHRGEYSSKRNRKKSLKDIMS